MPRFPNACAPLAGVLPAVLRRSKAEAALLVVHLPAADRERLRTALLCLHCTQCTAGASLPTVLVWRILNLALA